MKKLLLIILSFTLMISVVNASEPQKMWEKTWGDDNYNELFLSVSSYEKEFYYVGGIKTYSFLRFTSDVTPISLFDIKKDNPSLNVSLSYTSTIIKYDKDGNVLWEKVLETRYISYVKATPEGDVLAVTVDGYNNDGGLQINLIKYDGNGNQVWTKNFTIDYYQTFCGTFSNCEINTSLIDFSSNGDIFFMIGSAQRTIIKLDKNGNTIWRKDLVPMDINNETPIYFSSTLDNEDNVVLSGYIIATDDDENDTYYKTIIKYDKDGKLKFNNKTKVNDGLQSLPMSIASNKNGEYVVLNLNYIMSEDDTSDEGTSLVFEIYDKNGKLKSTKKLTSDSSNAFTNTVKLSIDNSGNYVVSYYYGDMFYTRRYNSDLKLIDGITPTDKKLFFGYDYDKNNDFVFVGGQETKARSIYDDDESLQSVLVDTAIIEKYSVDYAINKEAEGEGTIEVNLDNAKAGDEITIEAKAAPGYRIDKIIVTDKDGKVIEVSGNKFVMPESDVTVKVIFTNSPLVNPKTGVISITFAVLSISVYAFFQYKYFKNKEMNL